MKKNDDYYTKLAKRQGYPARSVYKLKEIQEKYRIIKKSSKVLDLGAAPGSWSQYVLEILQGNGRVTGVDLKTIHFNSPFLSQYKVIRGSFKNENVLLSIKDQGPYNLILSDAAPSTSGDSYVDACKSSELVGLVINIAKANLIKKGSLVLKIFQGGEERFVYQFMKKLFYRTKAFKPKASKRESVEIFYIGLNYQG